MRFIVYGAGAIGGVLGGRLFQADEDVVLIARGPHHDALRDRGLTIECPTGSVNLSVPVVDHPSRITFTDDDVVLLAVKGQHTGDAIDALDAAAPGGVPVVSLQNGLENERRLLRTLADVYPVCVMMPAAHLEPGVVQASSTPVEGILDIGRHPDGVDDRAEAIAAAFRRAGFDSVARPDIARWKRRKLLLNLANAIDAVCGLDGAGLDLYLRVQDEGIRCLEAASLDLASVEEDNARREGVLHEQPIDGRERAGSSGRQSLLRDTGSVESDYLNGEVVLLGRLHGVPTPANALLQRLAKQCARKRRPPGSMSPESVLALLDLGPAAPSSA
ncbi:MAG: 2-dehydropantoate 2-reductase [Ilumatobacteraceae bacterium]|nr:2-dehydropantoate 2-reductase [Ilumatobacteraceae bacterium]